MTPHPDFDELDLLAYADGHLDSDPVAKARFEAKLAQSAELADKARAYRMQTEALREAYGPRLAAPIPGRILDVLERPAARPRWGWAINLTVAAAVVVGGLAGWLVGSHSRPGNEAESRLVRTAYASLDHPNGRQRPLENAGLRTGAPDDSLSALDIHAPDLAHLGFVLSKSEILRAGRNRLDRLTYSAADGRKLYLFLGPRWTETKQGIQIGTKGHLSIAHWLQGPLASVLVSKLPADRLRPLANSVRRAIRHQGRLGPHATPAVAKPELTQPTFASEQGRAPIPATAVQSTAPVARPAVSD